MQDIMDSMIGRFLSMHVHERYRDMEQEICQEEIVN